MYPHEDASYTAVGMASWYGAAFHGRRTANGEVYDMASLTAAHPTMPLPSYARVTNLTNGYSVIVRVNDRGPYHGGRVMDVSSRAADVLGFKGEGTAKIKVEYVGRGADGRVRRQRAAGEPQNRRVAGQPERLFRADDGRQRRQAGPVAVCRLFRLGPRRAAARAGAGARADPHRRIGPVRAADPEPVRRRGRRAAAGAGAGENDAAGRDPDASAEGARSAPAAAALRPRDAPRSRPSPQSRRSRRPAAAVDVLPPRRPLVQASAEKALFRRPPSSR